MSEQNWGLLGHEWAVNLLKGHIIGDSVRHAYLLAGPPGTGRRTLALRFAQALNCPSPAGPGEPCGTCRTCKQIEAMQYPDLSVVQAETEGGVLKIEQVRAVQHALSLRPYQSKYRVAVFLRFQEANLNAQNAMLKTLEEVPAYVVLILTADNAEQLLPTITSRCETLRLRPSPVEAVASHLQAHGTDREMAGLLAHLSGGRPGYALQLQADPAGLDFRRERLDDLSGLLSADRHAKFAYAEKLAKDKETMRRVLLLWLSYWRDVMLRVSKDDIVAANIDREAEIRALAGRLSLAAARAVVADLERAIERLDANVNARLQAEVLLLDWPRLSGER